ncbi:hypothetical protein BOTBODRAFT_181992 [Botryobasidium botryosum FD-172 SS1]|uniref:Uncharacterized protein n=1 Tax=Botryobasidium botryosum (strain FD-172 SS1) TaxID=930990 RepID=A0A067M361_BOTB1|nr:hypothetical protein BOTBODRAFT_181992 [Botryobasidium botryosum FD-172 SS1]
MSNRPPAGPSRSKRPWVVSNPTDTTDIPMDVGDLSISGESRPDTPLDSEQEIAPVTPQHRPPTDWAALKAAQESRAAANKESARKARLLVWDPTGSPTPHRPAQPQAPPPAAATTTNPLDPQIEVDRTSCVVLSLVADLTRVPPGGSPSLTPLLRSLINAFFSAIPMDLLAEAIATNVTLMEIVTPHKAPLPTPTAHAPVASSKGKQRVATPPAPSTTAKTSAPKPKKPTFAEAAKAASPSSTGTNPPKFNPSPKVASPMRSKTKTPLSVAFKPLSPIAPEAQTSGVAWSPFSNFIATPHSVEDIAKLPEILPRILQDMYKVQFQHLTFDNSSLVVVYNLPLGPSDNWTDPSAMALALMAQNDISEPLPASPGCWLANPDRHKGSSASLRLSLSPQAKAAILKPNPTNAAIAGDLATQRRGATRPTQSAAPAARITPPTTTHQSPPTRPTSVSSAKAHTPLGLDAKAITIIHETATKFGLSLDKGKTKLYHHTMPNRTPIPDPPPASRMTVVPHMTWLGVTFSPGISMRAHFDRVLKKAAWKMHNVNLLTRRNKLSPALGIKLYLSIIHPTFTYACEAWWDDQTSVRDRLNIIQNKFLRKITGCYATMYAIAKTNSHFLHPVRALLPGALAKPLPGNPVIQQVAAAALDLPSEEVPDIHPELSAQLHMRVPLWSSGRHNKSIIFRETFQYAKPYEHVHAFLRDCTRSDLAPLVAKITPSSGEEADDDIAYLKIGILIKQTFSIRPLAYIKVTGQQASQPVIAAGALLATLDDPDFELHCFPHYGLLVTNLLLANCIGVLPSCHILPSPPHAYVWMEQWCSRKTLFITAIACPPAATGARTHPAHSLRPLHAFRRTGVQTFPLLPKLQSLPPPSPGERLTPKDEPSSPSPQSSI